tara:strand:- start:68342 stop:68938 length:597 start_codon:yes stop_codon:yes gene_type:complete
MNILFIGRPGSGKRIQGKLLSEELGYTSVISIDIIKDEIESGSDLGIELECTVNDGNLISAPTMNKLINKYLFKRGFEDNANGYVFDGYPRTIKQAENLDSIFKISKSKIDLVFFLEVDEIILIERTLRTGEISGREDDQHEDIILQRIKNYDKSTEPLKKYYEDKLHIIDGNKSIEDVQSDIMEILHQEITKKYQSV